MPIPEGKAETFRQNISLARSDNFLLTSDLLFQSVLFFHLTDQKCQINPYPKYSLAHDQQEFRNMKYNFLIEISSRNLPLSSTVGPIIEILHL